VLKWSQTVSRSGLLDASFATMCLLLLLDRAFVGAGVPRDIAGSMAWVFPLLCLAPLSLLVRRRAPLVTAVVVTAVPAVHAVLAGHAARGAFLLVPVCLGLYSLGAYGSTRSVLVGLTVGVAAETVATALDPNALQTASERWAWAFWLCVQVVIAVIGVFVAARRREQHARCDAVEAQRQAVLDAEAAVHAERARIARELHDVVTHNLNVVVLHATAAAAVVDADPRRVRRSLQAIESSGRGALVEMRRLLGMLRDAELLDRAPLVPQPRLDRLPDLVAEARAAGVDAALTVDISDQIDDGVELAAYRVVQESLSNVMKHAPGCRVGVSVRADDGHVVVDVTNTPAAHATARRPPDAVGHGLLGMRERVGVFDGHLSTGPCDDGGFRVRAIIPTNGSGW
jgi:signal transduction histidine kinase